MTGFGSSLYTDVGQVVLANPHLNFYQLRPSLTLEVMPLVINATAIGTAAGRWHGVGVQETYQVGDSVLFVWKKDAFKDQKVNQAIIIGKCSVDYSFKKRSLQTLFTEGLNLWNSGIYDVHGTQLQRTPFPYDYNSNGFAGLFAGDWSVHGKQSGLLIGDDTIGFKAGQVSVIADAVSRRLEENSLLRTVNTIGSSEDICIYNRSLVYISRYAGNPLDAYGNGMTETPYEVRKAEEDWTPVYRLEHAFGDALYGEEHNMYTTDGVLLGGDRFRYDGLREFSSKSGISLERNFDLRRFRYIGRRFEAEDATQDISPTPENPQLPLLSSELWDQGDIADPMAFLYEPVPEGHAEKTPAYTELFEDDLGVHYAAPGKSHIRQLPSGGISIMDAWGSELRMEGGNIQLSAANNFIQVIGRDSVQLISGVKSVAASKGVQIASAEGSIKMYGKRSMQVSSDEELTLEGVNTVVTGKESAVFIGDSLQFVSKNAEQKKLTGGKGIQFLADGSTISFSGNSVLMAGESSATVIGGQSAIALTGTSAVLGSSQLQVTGQLLVKAGSFNVSVPDIQNEKLKTVTIPGGGTSSFVCDGFAIVNGVLKCNDQLGVVGNISAYSVSAVSHTSNGGLFKAIRQKKSAVPGSITSRVTSAAQRAASSLQAMFRYIKSSVLQKLRFRFGLSAPGSVMVKEPLFSYSSTGTVRVTAPVTVDGDSKRTYIYPGEEFWTKNGMSVYQEPSMVVTDPSGTYESQGAVNLRLSPSTAKDE